MSKSNPKMYIARLTFKGGESAGAFIYYESSNTCELETSPFCAAQLEQMFGQAVYYNQTDGQQIVVDISDRKKWVQAMKRAVLRPFECDRVDVFDEAPAV